MDITPNILRSKDNHTMKFGQLIVHKTMHIFIKNHEENEAGRLVLDLFLFFKKVSDEVKESGLWLSFNIF